MHKNIHELCLTIWKEERLSEDWNKAIIIPLHKKGGKLECNNYRGIALLNTVYQVFARILLKVWNDCNLLQRSASRSHHILNAEEKKHVIKLYESLWKILIRQKWLIYHINLLYQNAFCILFTTTWLYLMKQY